MSQYTFGLTVAGELEEVRARVIAALADEGFGVLTEIDVAATMKAKLDIDVAPYRILGACNPPLAHQALTADPKIGALLPCNVVVRQSDDGIAIDFMDPYAVLTLVEMPGIEELATEVRGRLEKVKTALATT